MYKYERLFITVFFIVYIPVLLYMVLNVINRTTKVRAGLVVVDEQLQPYVDRFKAEAYKRGKTVVFSDIIILFGETRSEAMPNRVGYCASTWPRSIVISREVFKNMDEASREMLIFHEFGHCVLDLPHDEACNIEQYPCKFPKSIMYPSVESKHYIQNRDAYLDELFNKTP